MTAGGLPSGWLLLLMNRAGEEVTPDFTFFPINDFHDIFFARLPALPLGTTSAALARFPTVSFIDCLSTGVSTFRSYAYSETIQVCVKKLLT